MSGYAIIDTFSDTMPAIWSPERVMQRLQLFAEQVFMDIDIELEPEAKITPMWTGKVPKGVTVTSGGVTYELVITNKKKYGKETFSYVTELRQS